MVFAIFSLAKRKNLLGNGQLTILKKDYDVTLESFDSLYSYWQNKKFSLRWDCLFVLPQWLEVWWNEFGATSDLYLCSIRQREDVIGIAPLLVKGKKALLIGDTDVCDYLDFIVAPGKGPTFFSLLLEHLSQEGIIFLDLKPLRPDSSALTDLAAVVRKRGGEVSCDPLDTSFEMDLPATWDQYLFMLNGKQRHEIRRKLRRLHETTHVDFRVVESPGEVRNEMDTFFELFRSNREDKAAFMTDQMVSYFRSLAEAMAEAKILKLYFLDLNATTSAATMCFDYNSTIYLYNNSYDRRFSSLSVGLLCKVISIKDSIQNQKKKYDFLKGVEAYKHRLGGREVPLYRCRIQI